MRAFDLELNTYRSCPDVGRYRKEADRARSTKKAEAPRVEKMCRMADAASTRVLLPLLHWVSSGLLACIGLAWGFLTGPATHPSSSLREPARYHLRLYSMTALQAPHSVKMGQMADAASPAALLESSSRLALFVRREPACWHLLVGPATPRPSSGEPALSFSLLPLVAPRGAGADERGGPAALWAPKSRSSTGRRTPALMAVLFYC